MRETRGGFFLKLIKLKGKGLVMNYRKRCPYLIDMSSKYDLCDIDFNELNHVKKYYSETVCQSEKYKQCKTYRKYGGKIGDDGLICAF